MIRPGELRERVTIQVATESRNALGETTLSFSDFTTRWASVEGVSAREAALFGQQDTTVTHRVRMRYVEGLKQTMRLMWRGRVLEIESLLEHANRSEHELVCLEKT